MLLRNNISFVNVDGDIFPRRRQWHILTCLISMSIQTSILMYVHTYIYFDSQLWKSMYIRHHVPVLLLWFGRITFLCLVLIPKSSNSASATLTHVLMKRFYWTCYIWLLLGFGELQRPPLSFIPCNITNTRNSLIVATQKQGLRFSFS